MNTVRAIFVMQAALFATGMLVFYTLAAIPNIEEFKLFNLFGLSLDILGLLLLSELIIKSVEHYRFITKYSYVFLWSAVICLPFGMTLGGFAAPFFDLPSSEIVLVFSMSLFVIVSIPAYLLDSSGEIFKLSYYRSPTRRVVFMGTLLLGSGLIMQLIGAVLDLQNST